MKVFFPYQNYIVNFYKCAKTADLTQVGGKEGDFQIYTVCGTTKKGKPPRPIAFVILRFIGDIQAVELYFVCATGLERKRIERGQLIRCIVDRIRSNDNEKHIITARELYDIELLRSYWRLGFRPRRENESRNRRV